MSACKHYLPGFRTTCIIVGVLYVFLSGNLFLRGLMESMAAYQVPQEQLLSPHYYDAIFWVYLHMMVIGIIISTVGLYAENEKFKTIFSRLLFGLHIVYTYIDFIHSDSALGNGLYKGAASVFPAIISLVVTILFLHLSICSKARKGKTANT